MDKLTLYKQAQPMSLNADPNGNLIRVDELAALLEERLELAKQCACVVASDAIQEELEELKRRIS